MIRWSPEAADDFERIINYIREQNPSAAARIARSVYERISSLESFPNSGRIGRVEETRELVLAPLPFVAVYRLRDNIVEVARILHGAQRWP